MMMDEGHSSRRTRRPVAKKRSLVSVPVVLGVALAALIAVGGLIYLGEALRAPEPTLIGNPSGDGSRPTSDQGGTSTTQQPAPVAGMVYDGRSKGAKEAPVEILEYADFQCPFCAQYESGTGRQVDETYVARGLVRVTFRHFAFIGPESTTAAVAAECANDQGKFWPYHDKLFANQDGENKGAFAPDKLKRFARDLGLDSAGFDACLDSNKYESLVRDQRDGGVGAGVRSTPTFFVSGQRVEGALPFANFKTIIENELAKRR